MFFFFSNLFLLFYVFFLLRQSNFFLSLNQMFSLPCSTQPSSRETQVETTALLNLASVAQVMQPLCQKLKTSCYRFKSFSNGKMNLKQVRELVLSGRQELGEGFGGSLEKLLMGYVPYSLPLYRVQDTSGGFFVGLACSNVCHILGITSSNVMAHKSQAWRRQKIRTSNGQSALVVETGFWVKFLRAYKCPNAHEKIRLSSLAGQIEELNA